MSVIKEIGAVRGVDALFIGPNDLAADMGHLGNPRSQEVRDAILAGLGDMKSVGVPAGILDFDEDEALRLFHSGFDFVAVGGDGSLLAKHTTGLVHRLSSELS